MKLPAYDPSAPPSTFEHRGDECVDHGPNVPHFRVKGEPGPFFCVACAQEQLVAEPVSGVREKTNGAADYAAVAAQLTADLDQARADTRAARKAALDATAELDGERATVAELRRTVVELEAARETARVHAEGNMALLREHRRLTGLLEDRRIVFWWNTFNAVISGLVATPPVAAHSAIAAAVDVADNMHGPLKPEPEGV